MRLKGFVGPAYTLKSVNVECQRCVNLYPEINEVGTGKEGEVAHLLNTPGLENLIEVGDGPIRMVHVDPLNTMLVVSGEELYKVAFSGSIWSSTLVGTLNTLSGTVIAASTLLANGDTITVMVDGTDSYAYRVLSGVETFDDFSGLSYSQVDGATHVVFIDGYFIYNSPDSNQFYVSEWGSFGTDPLSFASAEGDPDKIMALIANHRDLWIVNERTTEVWSNTGNADFPFERLSGGFLEKGCVAPYSLAKIDGTILWLGRDQSGHGAVYAASGLTPQRISTHAIEREIQTYDIDSITTADSYTYNEGGHSFYVLNFPSATWVYDLTTKLWHERAYNDEGTLTRHRTSYHAFLPLYGLHIAGDYENNKIYKLDDTISYDDDVPIIKIRSSPHVSAGLKRVFCKSFQLDMEVGVGLDGGVQGSDPTIMLDYSDDGGHSWSNEKFASAGAMGQYKTRAIWRRLGNFRDRVFRIKISDPIRVVILGAELDVEVGVN